MKKAISWFKECDGRFCDMVAELMLTVITLALMIHCLNLIA